MTPPAERIHRTILAPIVLLVWAFTSVGLQRLQPIALPLGATGSIVARVGIVLGAALWLWTAFTFWRHKTPLDPTRSATTLVTDGPFRFSRNPAYLGLMTAMTGMVLLNEVAWALILLPAALFALNRWTIPTEEADLEKAFGDEYQRYRRTVRRWMGRKTDRGA